MATFQVDTMEIQRSAYQLLHVADAMHDLVPQFADLLNLASATGDAACAQAFSTVADQWRYEIVASTLALRYFSIKLTNAANEYVYTEAAISDTEVYFYDVETL